MGYLARPFRGGSPLEKEMAEWQGARLGKRVYSKGYPGFESRLFRNKPRPQGGFFASGSVSSGHLLRQFVKGSAIVGAAAVSPHG